MSNIFPIQSAANFQPQNDDYRLYIQYKSTDVDICSRGFVSLQLKGCILIETKDYPIKTCIRPASQSIKKVLKDLGTENTFNIIIDGSTQEKLEQLSKFYTSLEYWNSVSYLKEMVLIQQYEDAAIKQVIKSKGKDIDTLVLGFRSPTPLHRYVQRFEGPPKMGSRYTLHTKFEKPTSKPFHLATWKRFNFRSLPISCSILEVDGPTKTGNCSGPTIEFFIKSDDLSVLKEMKRELVDLRLPSSKCTWGSFHIYSKPECIEVGHQSSENDKYIINIGEYKFGFETSFLYG